MPRKFSTPQSKLPFLSPAAFEDEAALLLAEYGNQHGHITDPPIPIDEIVEEHFKIVIEYRNLQAEFPEGDVLGAMYFNQKTIVIDQTLVPDDNPAMRGRYRFTVAHELAHWRLHRQFYLRRAHEPALLQSMDGRPDHLQRAHSHDPKEYQANRLAACILMPREMVKRVWHEVYGSMEPVCLTDLKANPSDTGTDEAVLEKAVRPLATRFEVSPEAMRIRAESMELLLRKREASLFG